MSDLGLAGMGEARSREGHAAMSMRGTDDRWIQIQRNTFTNWVNEQLRTKGDKVDDLQTDFCDGIRLCTLMEVLLNKRIGRVVRKPLNQHQYLENVTLALRAMVSDNIKLVNIGSEDIVNGNLKLILAMVWHLILRYQIGKQGKVPPKKLMIAWLQAVIPECGIANFNHDWNDGVALHALIDYCKPGTCPNWRQLSRADGLNNCRNAMELAKEHFGIPLVLSPENLSSPDLDELSGMTYLSYFMKVDSPGYNATLNWVRDVVKNTNVQNFQTDWNNGTALADLVTSLGGSVPGYPNDWNTNNMALWETNCQKCMEAAKSLSVQPIITAKEMADLEVDHLGVMAYAAWFQHLKPIVPKKSVAEMIQLGSHENECKINKPTSFQLLALEDSVNKNNVHVEVVGPNSKPSVTLRWHGGIAEGEFIPQEPGFHKIIVYNEGQVIKGCPASLKVSKPDISNIMVTAIDSCAVGCPTEIRINALQAQQGNVRVEAKAPSGHLQDLLVQDSSGVYTANFTPTEVGDWLISIMYDGEHIQGSPFNVRVYDAAQVKVFGLEGGAVGKTFSFSADCTAAGEGNLTVDITHNGRSVPCTIDDDKRGISRVSFTPDGAGIYTIRVYFAGMEVSGSPYTLEIVDSNAVTATGEGLSMVAVNRQASFMVNARGAGGGDIKVNVTSPSGATVPSRVMHQGNDTYLVEYSPKDVGEYLIEVLFFGKHISGSPFRVQAFDWNRISVHNLKSSGMINRMVEFDIDASNAGSGNLEIMVNDGTIPCSVQNRGNRNFHATFVPKEPIPHYIQMKFNGKEVPGSPWRVDMMRDASRVTATGQGLQLISLNRIASFEVRAEGAQPGDIAVNITSPTRRPVPAQVINSYNGVFRVEYTPVEVGNYLIEVLYAGMPINGSPFTSKVYDSSSITISNIPPGVIGKPVEFTIDVTQGGEGQLEIMVNNGAVPNSVKMLRKGVFLVSFVPQAARPHSIDVKFNGELLPMCPISVPMMDASRVTVQGEGIRQVAVNKQSYFKVNTQSAGEADLSVRVTSPQGHSIPAHLTQTPTGYDIAYTAPVVGLYRVDMDYATLPIPGSPFSVKAYDPSKVIVSTVQDGIVGKQSSFTVDPSEAGEGNMEIAIAAGGRNIPNHVRQVGQGKFEVSYTPVESGSHLATVTFNGDAVPGSPFNFSVMDASKVTATGSGLDRVPCNKMAYFTVNAQGAKVGDLEVRVIGPDGRDTHCRIRNSSKDSSDVEWMPVIVGDHRIEVKYMNTHISGSPFTGRAYDTGMVRVSGISQGRLGVRGSFHIDASRAGAGNLEIIVSVNGENVPNFVKAEGNNRFEVFFTPTVAESHMISVKFNGETVPGSPFYCALIDGSKATASGEGLRLVSANKVASFDVDTQGIGEGELEAEIISPSGQPVPANIMKNGANFKVEYTPREVGRHRVNVRFVEADITNSPFLPEVYDAALVRVGNIGHGLVGKPVYFDVNASRAGEGTLTVDVRGASGNNAYTEIKAKGNACYEVSFVPREASTHYIDITFNGEKVPSSPFKCDMVDTSNVFVNWGQLKNIPVNRQVVFDVEAKGTPEADLLARITSPSHQQFNGRVAPRGPDGYQVDFTPTEVGGYVINVTYGGQSVVGSPCTCYCYDASKVKVIEVDPQIVMGQEMGFTVDIGEAGQGDIDAEVMYVSSEAQQLVLRLNRHKINDNQHRFTYLPQQAVDHVIDVKFNYEQVPGCPITVKGLDPLQMMAISGRSMQTFHSAQEQYSLVETQGYKMNINQATLNVKAPHGELVPAKIVQQPDGDYKVEYSSKYTGRHTVEILYAGQAIMGSPFYVEIYDPNKLRVEGTKSGMVGDPTGFEVIKTEAGRAELGLTITSPSGKTVPFEALPTAQGDRITYVPQEVGNYGIFLTYGGLEVPGCPLSQTINDVGMATASGDGLHRGEEDKPATFFVDAKGMRGDLFVQVDGPNSIAKCNIEPDQSGRYIVTYVPVEVGIYDVQIKWNGREIPGSPFHPKIVDPRKVRVAGGWQSLMDASNRVHLQVNEVKRIEFHTMEAGPGKLSGEVRGPSGAVPVEIESRNDGVHVFSFVPKAEGEHSISVMWAELPMPKSPYLAFAHGAKVPIDHSKVVLTGRGLKEARVKEEAEFVIDGTDAGPGTPMVTLTGVKTDIEVHSTALDANKYRCTYTPQVPGAYLLNIMWSDRQVKGSPFKVNVSAPSDASKVVCTGEGIKMGIIGREIKSLIDTRRAGPGELTAHCMGPHKVAYCELYDHRDGTFTLNIRPQEPGRHVLQVKYGGIHVPGSPFVLRVSGAPDASKVRVTGPGVEPGILATYQSRFICDTRGAGAGQLTVRIRGPKGAFRVEMQRESQKDRTILCRYDPTEVGDYIIHVKWSGEHVPGSPFQVQIFDTQEQLESFLAENPQKARPKAWNAEI